MIFIASHLIGVWLEKRSHFHSCVVLFDHSFKGLESQHNVFYDSQADIDHMFFHYGQNLSVHMHVWNKTH